MLHDERKWRILGKRGWCAVQVNACKSKLQGAGSLARPTLDVNKV